MNNAGTSRNPLPVVAYSNTRTVYCPGCKRQRSQLVTGKALCKICVKRAAP